LVIGTGGDAGTVGNGKGIAVFVVGIADLLAAGVLGNQSVMDIEGMAGLDASAVGFNRYYSGGGVSVFFVQGCAACTWIGALSC